MKMPAIKPHWKPYLRCSIWLACMAVSTAIAGLYAGARWAAITPALWLVFFVPMVLMPIVKPTHKN